MAAGSDLSYLRAEASETVRDASSRAMTWTLAVDAPFRIMSMPFHARGRWAAREPALAPPGYSLAVRCPSRRPSAAYCTLNLRLRAE